MVEEVRVVVTSSLGPRRRRLREAAAGIDAHHDPAVVLQVVMASYGVLLPCLHRREQTDLAIQRAVAVHLDHEAGYNPVDGSQCFRLLCAQDHWPHWPDVALAMVRRFVAGVYEHSWIGVTDHGGGLNVRFAEHIDRAEVPPDSDIRCRAGRR